MTQDEYDILIARRKEINDKLKGLNSVAWEILKVMGTHHRGGVEFLRIEEGHAIIKFRVPGCSCHPDDDTVKVPAAWMFGADFVTEIGRQKDEEKRLEDERELAEAEAEKKAQEERDIEEFKRLQEKFGSQTQSR